MAIGQCRSAISFDDVAQKTTLARSAHQNNAERTSKLVEEQCDEFVPLGSVRFQGLKTIDVIERNGPPKNSVALEPGDLEVDFVRFFPIFLRAIFPFFRGGAGRRSQNAAFDTIILSLKMALTFWVILLMAFSRPLREGCKCKCNTGAQVHR